MERSAGRLKLSEQKRKMENVEKKAHCLVLCYPSQGHINPLLQFSKRLEHRGIKATLVTTHFLSKSLHRDSSTSSISLESISDGYDDGGVAQAESLHAYLERFRQIGPQSLAELVERMGSGSSCPVDCVVYDSVLPWALDVAKNFGLLGAAFLTQSCAVDSIYYHVNQGLLAVPFAGDEILLPGLPPLELQDMPSFVHDLRSYPALSNLLTLQFSNIDRADWVLCNSWYELEEEVAEWLGKFLPFRTIGPAIPSMYLDKQLENDKDYGFSIYKPNTESCMNWLNARSKGSVVYVSFGSIANLEADEMEELAWGLKASGRYFLWVVRESEQAKLPKRISEEMSEKGLVVSWCPQLEVLAHEATGCFLTHCGWNSTLEALSLGVPMVAMPQWSDQRTNAKYIMDVWKTGLRVTADEKGTVRRESIARCINEILESENGEEMKKNATKWSQMAKEAIVKDGSSDKNIDEFVANLVYSKNL